MSTAVKTSLRTLKVLLAKASEAPDATPEDRASCVWRPKDRALLTRSGPNAIFDSWSQPDRERNARIFLGAFAGFFQCAADGTAFVPPERTRERFGTSLAENYPEASPSFLKFATTYWTLKIVHNDQLAEEPEMVLTYLLAKLEEDVAAVFFPTPGPIRIPPAKREQNQRELLMSFAPQIDIEDFIGGNPILARDRANAGSGCLGMLIALALLVSASFLSLS